MKYIPSIDVIIASKNEENHIENCLKSVFNQDYPENKINILLVDGISSDSTIKIVESLFSKEINCKILENKKIIQSEAWNLGINNSTSEIICILSAHCTIGVDYLKNVVSVFHETKADLIGGHMIAKGKGYIGKTIEFLHHSKFGIGVGKFHDPNFEGAADTVYTLNFKRSILNNNHPFDNRLIRNQDIEFSSKILKSGGKIFLSKKLDIIYKTRDSINDFVKQYFNNGLWILPTKIISKETLSLRHFIPLFFTIFIFLIFLIEFSYISQLIPSNIIFLFRVILILYVVLNIIFSLKTGLEKGIKYIFSTFLLFFLLHFSYGLGTIFGIKESFGLRKKNEQKKDI